MDELKHAISGALKSEDGIARDRVRQWCQEAQDIEVLALLYRLTSEAWDRIEPRLEGEETWDLIRRYLLRCIRENPQGGVALTRYEAAGELEVWFDHLADMSEDKREILQDSAAAVTELFLSGDEEVRGAIETGFLEHILEQRALRHLFEHWAQDDRLREAWERALAWGEAHPDFMKRLRHELRSSERDQL